MAGGHENFKTKLEIAFDEIIEPLKIPKGMNLCIVFDSWWSSKDLINKCINLGHSVVCQIKSDSKVGIIPIPDPPSKSPIITRTEPPP